jgi:hypothetical protein
MGGGCDTVWLVLLESAASGGHFGGSLSV